VMPSKRAVMTVRCAATRRTFSKRQHCGIRVKWVAIKIAFVGAGGVSIGACASLCAPNLDEQGGRCILDLSAENAEITDCLAERSEFEPAVPILNSLTTAVCLVGATL
jgi:hypothetical protein